MDGHKVVLSRGTSRDGTEQPVKIPSRPVPNFGCPGPSRPFARFLACPVVPLSRDNDGTSVPLSRKVSLSRPVGNASWIWTKARFDWTHVRFNGMSNRLLCPISFASKMWNWSPVIGKVECIKVEDIKIGLLWCFDFVQVNYYSISKQQVPKLVLNPKL